MAALSAGAAITKVGLARTRSVRIPFREVVGEGVDVYAVIVVDDGDIRAFLIDGGRVVLSTFTLASIFRAGGVDATRITERICSRTGDVVPFNRCGSIDEGSFEGIDPKVGKHHDEKSNRGDCHVLLTLLDPLRITSRGEPVEAAGDVHQKDDRANNSDDVVSNVHEDGQDIVQSAVTQVAADFRNTHHERTYFDLTTGGSASCFTDVGAVREACSRGEDEDEQ